MNYIMGVWEAIPPSKIIDFRWATVELYRRGPMNYIMGVWDEGAAVEPDPLDLNRRGRLR
jgi:hypothetical protein